MLARRVVVLSVLLQLLALAVPLFTAIVVNRIVPAGDRHLLLVLAVAMAALSRLLLPDLPDPRPPASVPAHAPG